jgi:RNA polymerase sigma-70 factor (ECF subfamily)
VVNVDGRDLRSDEALLVAMGDADRGALTELYRRHAAWLTVRLTHRCGDSDVVDLALHDTFMAVWRKPGSYRGSGQVGGWLWGIAIRRLLDQLRRRPALTYLSTIEQLVVSAEDEVLVGLHHGELADALDRLSPELLSVVQATVLDGLSTRETAKLLRIPIGTVKSRNARAREQLREALT